MIENRALQLKINEGIARAMYPECSFTGHGEAIIRLPPNPGYNDGWLLADFFCSGIPKYQDAHYLLTWLAADANRWLKFQQVCLKVFTDAPASYLLLLQWFAMRTPGDLATIAALSLGIVTEEEIASATITQSPTDSEMLDFLQETIVDTIYMDSGEIIDVRGGNLRVTIAQAMERNRCVKCSALLEDKAAEWCNKCKEEESEESNAD